MYKYIGSMQKTIFVKTLTLPTKNGNTVELKVTNEVGLGDTYYFINADKNLVCRGKIRNGSYVDNSDFKFLESIPKDLKVIHVK